MDYIDKSNISVKNTFSVSGHIGMRRVLIINQILR